ncbi:hypothetical protein [Haloprofundus halobius]|uniref:hypothetical protein n=1 Tax=Haloprofundus halobius TaxID=2876194 RepID=UPI001CCBC3F7|nr:hypothetical protein [Haloprofundus halobius]
MADTDVSAEDPPSRSDGGQSSTSSSSSSSQPGALTLGDLFGSSEKTQSGPGPTWLLRHGMYIGAILLVGFVILPELLLSFGAGWPVGFAWALAEGLRYGAVILAGLYAVNVAITDAFAD